MEYQLEHVEAEREKARKKVKKSKAVVVTTQVQQQSCFIHLEEFAQKQWSKVMANVLLPIKLREKLACRAACIQYIDNLEDELKLDCLLRTFIF